MSTSATSIRSKKNFRVLKESGSDRQIVCFPFSGGNANSFLQFAKAFSMDVEILAFTPPGHGGDNSPLIDDLEELTKLCRLQLAGLLKKRVILLGYSMGAMIAYRLAQQWLADGQPLPELLILSATTTPEDFATKEHVSQFDDKPLISYLDELGGLEPVLKTNPEIMDYFLPILRNDFSLVDYNTIRKEPLPVPAAVIYGTEDTLSQRRLDCWPDYFSAPPKIYAVDGRHMFIRSNLTGFCRTMAQIFVDFKLV
jgi:external thioesterase TEII